MKLSRSELPPQSLHGICHFSFLISEEIFGTLGSFFQSYRGRREEQVFVLSAEARETLLIVSVLLPMSVSNLRAEVNSRLAASDASNWGEAGVVSSLPSKIGEELLRHTLRKSLWVKLLAPAAAWAKSHGSLDVQSEVPKGVELYKRLFVQKKGGQRHINIGELRAPLKVESKLGQSERSTRILLGCNSQVALGALIKGRSSSPSLNRELCQSVPLMLAFDSYLERMYFETSVNRADDPTRGREVRGAQRSTARMVDYSCQRRYRRVWQVAR